MSSSVAGTKQSIIAGLPILFKSVISNESPAFAMMIINAIFLRSPDISIMELSRTFKTYGPNSMPAKSIPMIRGSWILETIHPNNSPARMIIPMLNNIVLSSFRCKKADNFPAFSNCRSHQLYQRFGFASRETSFPYLFS